MKNRLSWRVPALLCVLAAMTVLLVHMAKEESVPRILGIPIMSQAEYAACAEQGFTDETVQLLFNQVPAAVDEETHTVYVSQQLREQMTLEGLEGSFSTGDFGTELYFVESTADVREAIAQGTAFRLVAKYWGGCAEFKVVFTSLPVMDLTVVKTTGADLEAVFTGQMVLWDPMDARLQGPRVTSSTARWNYRGRSTLKADKKSYRLSLKTKTGDKENHQLLDLGFDDDWIVNAVVNDCTRIRENLISELWQQMLDTNDVGVPMSQGRYIEVVCDGRYQGMYLLQRKIDAKFLDMGDDDVLLKGIGIGENGVWSAVEADDRGDNRSSAEAIEICKQYYEEGMGECLALNNWLDVELLVQLGCLRDNRSYKNMYVWMRAEKDGWDLWLVPWDVDMSFGYGWKEGIGFVYDPARFVGQMFHRREYEALSECYPDLDRQLALRWQELRKTVFTEETVQKIVADNVALLEAAGACGRDYEKWGCLYHQEDTVEAMLRFITQRFSVLDAYYESYL